MTLNAFPLAHVLTRTGRAFALGCLALLVSCAGAPTPTAPAEPLPVRAARYPASFDCTQAQTSVQLYVCRDATLAAADVRLHVAWREQVRRLDPIGRAELLAEHRQWQLSLDRRCDIVRAPEETESLPAAPLACLRQAWLARLESLGAMALPPVVSPAAAGAASDHPLAAYVMLREAQSLEPALCPRLASALNGLLARTGGLDLSRWPQARLLASVGPQPIGVLPDGRRIEVQQHDAGPYGSYALRGTGLVLAGQAVLDDRSVPMWMLELPNAGGSFSSTSSQTGDVAGIDVFAFEQRTFVLVTQTWGYYAAAARGESPHAALYEVAGEGLQRRCLWRTYTTPPVAQALREWPQFKTWLALLEEAAGPDSPRLPPDDRRDAGLLAKELQWTLLHMPLVAVHEAAQYRRWPQLRQRHDEALQALFDWSERNVPSKQLYRRVMPLLGAVHAELLRAFQGKEGLRSDEARAAADLVLMTTLARAAERWIDPTQSRPALVGVGYRPRWPVAPAPGDLERERPYASLHSALLNRAPDAAVDTLWRSTWGPLDRVGDAAAARGPAGDTPLMAAVRSPERVARLLAAGADVNARNDWGKTALMSAAQADQADVVQALLDAGADVHARTHPWQADGAGGLDNAEGARAGSTAFTYAAGNASAALIERLWLASGRPTTIGSTACQALKANAKMSPTERAAWRQRGCPD